MKPPKDVKSLQSFLGLVNYLTRYSGRLPTLSAPLRDLTKKDTAYSWGPEQDWAFTEVKKEVSSLGVLRYFDLHAETVIETDASLKGLGAVLLQDALPVWYASKALTKTEQWYSNIEREALGIIWGLKQFHYFIYGKSCTSHTDQKPLETIFKKKLSNCSARIQRFVLRALKYDDTVKYVKRAEVPITDALSRVSPLPAPPEGEFPQLDIQQIIENLPASPTKLQQIRNETANDPTLSKLFDVIHQGWPATREKCSNALQNFHEELTIENGLILKQERIVMPNTLSTARAIINHLKSIFAEHGIPERLTTNGPQFASQEFRDFMQTYGVEHVTSSPMYPQTNGSAERMVQTVENILKKCEEEGEDPYLGLLSHRTTPVSGNLKSLAELLNNCKFRTTLLMSKRVSVSETTSKTKEETKTKTRDNNYKHSTTTRLLDRHYNHFSQVSLSTSMTTTLRDGNEEQLSDLRRNQDPSSLRMTDQKVSTFALDHSWNPDPR